MRVLCALLILLAVAPAAAEELTVEEALDIVRSRLGAEALPDPSLGEPEYRLETDGGETRLVVEMIQVRSGPEYRFVRRGESWVLSGLSFPEGEAPLPAGGEEASRAYVDLLPDGQIRLGAEVLPAGAGEELVSALRAEIGRSGAGLVQVNAGERAGEDPAVAALLGALRRAGALRVELAFAGEPPPPPEPESEVSGAAVGMMAGAGGVGAIRTAKVDEELEETPEAAPAAAAAASVPSEEAPDPDAATRRSLERIGNALERFQRSEGAFPICATPMPIRERDRQGDFLSPMFLRRVPREDGWGQPLYYSSSRGGTTYVVRSSGPDLQLETEDDLVYSNGRFRAP
jgi:hypothetical protein